MVGMIVFIQVSVFALGLIIGSFLNVVLYRLHTGRSLKGRSHCLSCLSILRWFELLPLVSYLGLRGRCRSCRARIPSRYFLVEFLTGALFVVCWQTIDGLIPVLLSWLAASVLVLVFVYDMRHQIIPDELTVLLLVVAVSLIGYHYHLVGSLTAVFDSFIAAIAATAFFGFIFFVSGGRWMGFGDVKLVFPLALFLPPILVFSMVLLAFYIGAAVSLCLLGIQALSRRGQLPLPFFTQTLTIKGAVPFAPFLIAGWLLTYFGAFDLLKFFIVWPI